MTSGAQRRGKVGRVDANFDLFDDRTMVLMFVLDRIFDRNDVSSLSTVDRIDQGREGRRFARAGRATDEHEAAR
jgi:hypothetical protein